MMQPLGSLGAPPPPKSAIERLRRLMGLGSPPPPHRPVWIWKRMWLCENCPQAPRVDHTKAAAALHALDTGHAPQGVVWECNWILHVVSAITYSTWWERIPSLTKILINTTCHEILPKDR